MDKYKVLSIITTVLALALVVLCSTLYVSNTQKDDQLVQLKETNAKTLNATVVLAQKDLVYAMLDVTQKTGGLLSLSIENKTYEYVLAGSPLFYNLTGR